MTPVEANDEEIVAEDDSELLLERIEEEMAAEDHDTEDDEDVFLNVNDLNKVNIITFSYSAPDEADNLSRYTIAADGSNGLYIAGPRIKPAKSKKNTLFFVLK